MASEIEFEIKAPSPSDGAIRQATMELHDSGEETIVDVYYDRANRALFRRGVFVRVRNGSSLEVKYNPDLNNLSHLSCLEQRYPLDASSPEVRLVADFLGQFLGQVPGPIESFEALLRKTELEPFVTLEKVRHTYVDEGVEFAVDEIHDLGRFVEIEVKEPSRREWYVEWAKQLGLHNLTTGYVELWLRKHDFATYLSGRYLLPEDASSRSQ